jgi:predicted DCC family thiol-disulfide oxidoreductase YuxK
MGADNSVDQVVLFDGVCNLCSASVQFIIRHNKNADLKFASLQSEFGQSQLTKFQLSYEVKTIIFVTDGKALVRSNAALELCKYLDGFYPYLKILKIFPLFLRDLVYNIIARNRYSWFGKKDQCWIPTPDLANRFMK